MVILPYSTYKMDLARLRAAILASPLALPALRSRQVWGCKCTFLLASPESGEGGITVGSGGQGPAEMP